MLVTGCLTRALTSCRRAQALEHNDGARAGGCTSGLRHRVEGRATRRHQAAHLSFVAMLAIVAVAGLGAVIEAGAEEDA